MIVYSYNDKQMHQGLLLGIELFDGDDKLIASTLNRFCGGELPFRPTTVKTTEIALEEGERLIGINCAVMVRKKMISANYDVRFVIGKLEN